MAKIRLQDSDTGESTLDVVKVPEGFSLQLGYVEKNYESLSFISIISIILNREQVYDLITFLQEN